MIETRRPIISLMGRRITLVGFDADDTLWHNMPIFRNAHERFAEMLSEYHDEDWIISRLDQTEIVNLETYGYGIKGFALSMIETAIDLTEGRITGDKIRRIIDLSREMLAAPVDLIEGAEDTVRELGEQYEIALITKGDLFDQEAKLARSGLGDHFDHVHVVSSKDPATYGEVLGRIGVEPSGFAMVGDSLRSDVIPVAEIGGAAFHVPCEGAWSHEQVEPNTIPVGTYVELSTIAELPYRLSEVQG